MLNDYVKIFVVVSVFMFLQYQVIQQDVIEFLFCNVYWDNYDDGIYVDVVFGEFLFLLIDKFDSGMGWLSFIKFIDVEVVIMCIDCLLWMKCMEVWFVGVDSYFGYVFDDGFCVEGGFCYCMNLVVFCFILVEDFEKEGYGCYSFFFVQNFDSVIIDIFEEQL